MTEKTSAPSPQLQARLQQLATRSESPEAETLSAPIDDPLAERLADLQARKAAPTTTAGAGRTTAGSGDPAAPGGPRRKRRHPAKKSRYAALALSLVSTGGLAGTFAAIDTSAASIVTAQGGVVATAAAPASASSGGGSAAAASPVTSTSPAPAATVPDGAATTVVNGPATTVVNGDVFSNKFGPVQVQATFAADGTIASVDAVKVPFGDGKSVQINNRAVPALDSEALTAQSADVDTVSGATYTSIGYQRSLQSAIDTARAAGLTQLA